MDPTPPLVPPGPDGDKKSSSEGGPSTAPKTEDPNTLNPLKRPRSDDDDDKQDSDPVEDEAKAYNEDDINPAKQLGLLPEDQNNEPQSMLFEFATCDLEKLTEGRIGKLFVYKSGAVNFQIKDILYDVNPGSLGNTHRNVMAVNTTNKDCVDLGEVKKKGVVSLNLGLGDFLDDTKDE